MADDQTALIDRQDRLEERMTALEGTVKEEATLRAKTDLELSKITQALRAQKLSLQALHDTQSDQTRRLTIMEDDLRIVKKDVGTLKKDVSGLKKDVGTLKKDVSGLKEDVSGLKMEVLAGIQTIIEQLNRPN
jgi:chromosome segregation ATPase